MPTKNRAHSIRKVLRAIQSLDYPMDKTKLVFVDDYSTDGTFDIIRKWKTKIEKQYYAVVLIQERTNIPQARNLCIKNSEGNFLLFWDSDVIPPSNLLKQMMGILENNNEVGMIGSDYLYEHENMLSKLQGEPITDKSVHAVYMGFTLIRRDVFERVGKFNELLDVGEDTEFGIRVVENTNFQIKWAPHPVLHLKSIDETMGFGRSLVKWLSYNFHVRGEQYAKTLHKLPLLLKIRIIYYLFLPPLLALLSLVMYRINLILPILAVVGYLLPGMFMSVRGSSFRRGMISFFASNISTGVALAYGTFIQVIANSTKMIHKETSNTARKKLKIIFSTFWPLSLTHILARFIKSGNTLLDVGCGSGDSIELLKSKRKLNYTIGLDINPKAVMNAKSLYDEVVLADGRFLPFRNSAFDVVLCLEVIEHFFPKENAYGLLCEIERVAPVTILTTPSIYFQVTTLPDSSIYDSHKSFWSPQEFRERGYHTLQGELTFFLRGRSRLLARVGYAILTPPSYLPLVKSLIHRIYAHRTIAIRNKGILS